MKRTGGHAAAFALMLTAAAPAAGHALTGARAEPVMASASATRLAGLDPAALQRAIAIRPGDHTAGAIASVREGGGVQERGGGVQEEGSVQKSRGVQERGQEWRGQVADTVTGRPIPPDARIRIGSITKAFEAAIALQLAADHVIDLDRTIQSYLPGLLPSRYQPITIRELLDMTSGLPQIDEGAPAQTADQVIVGRFAQPTLGQIVQGTLRPDARPWPGPHFAPGTKQQYNSLNYRIVAYLIERRTGHPFAAELSTRILRPLHLTQTFPAISDGRPRPMPRPYLHGYIASDEGALVDVSEQGGDDTSMISTPRDIGRFFTALFSGTLLPPGQLRQMLSVPDVPCADPSDCLIGPGKGKACYGLGLQRLVLADGTTLWGKTGSDLGYFSAYFRTYSGSVSLFYSISETQVNGDGTAVGLRLAKAAGLPVS